MTENKTKATQEDVDAFLAAVDHPVRRADGQTLNVMFKRLTGWGPKMWGPTIVSNGAYHYVYASGREGDFLATGFSPRKANLSIYIMPGYQDYGHILARLGKHKMGKSCLYINKLAGIDMDVLEELVTTGLADLQKSWPIVPS